MHYPEPAHAGKISRQIQTYEINIAKTFLVPRDQSDYQDTLKNTINYSNSTKSCIDIHRYALTRNISRGTSDNDNDDDNDKHTATLR